MLNKTFDVYFSLLTLLVSVTVTQNSPPWAGNRRKNYSGYIEIDGGITIEASFTPQVFKPSRGPPKRGQGWRNRGSSGHQNFDEYSYDETTYVPPKFKPGRGPPPHARGWKNGVPPGHQKFYENPHEETYVRPHREQNPYPNINVPTSNDINEICGITHNSRIVGGVNAHPNKWTWMAALIRTDEDQSYCGGTLITRKHVLTAAHCVNNISPKDMFVRLGSYDFSENADASAEDINAVSFHIHPDFDKYTYLNDIAIIVLEKEASFSEFVRPICLPPQRRKFFGHLATVIGWGYKSYASGDSSSKLREVTVPIWNDTECNQAYKRDFENKALCAGYHEGGKDACQGDSGGPLMVQTARRKWCIVGIVSFGQNCGKPGYPGVYTRVNQFNSWIQRTLKETKENKK